MFYVYLKQLFFNKYNNYSYILHWQELNFALFSIFFFIFSYFLQLKTLIALDVFFRDAENLIVVSIQLL